MIHMQILTRPRSPPYADVPATAPLQRSLGPPEHPEHLRFRRLSIVCIPGYIVRMRKPLRSEINVLSASSMRNAAVVSPLTDSPAFLVRLAQLRAFDEFHRNFAGLGVTPAGFSVLALIAVNPGIRPGIIAEELRVKPSNIAALVNSLVAAGLVERTADASELRANLLRITKAGAKAWKEMEAIHRETDERFVEALTADERKRMVALLRKLLHR